MASETNTNVTETITAENNGGDPKGNADNADAVSTSGTKSEPTEKTFTQKELDDIVKSRLERATKGQPNKEELKAFREWQDSQKTAEQKALDDLAEANSAKQAAESEKQALEIKVSCLTKGVKPEYLDDVIALAAKYTDENTTTDKAVDAVLAKYPVFLGKGTLRAAPGITTGVRTQVASDSSGSKLSYIDIIKSNQVKRK